MRTRSGYVILSGLAVAALMGAAMVAVTGCPGRLDSLASFEAIESNPLAFTMPDVEGRNVTVGHPSDSVVVLFFNGEVTSDAMQPITTDIAAAYHDQHNIDFVNIVDLRTLEFYEVPFAAGSIRDAGARTIRRVNRRLEERGMTPIEGLHDHLFLIADENGVITQRYGVPDPNVTITAIVFDRSGRELGRFDPNTELDGVIAAIADSLESPGPSGSASAP